MNDAASNCPVCGAPAPARLRYSKLAVCEHCQTSLFLEDQVVKHAGVKSVLTDEPSLIELGRRYKYRNWLLETYGRVRFDYGDGFWDEWWVMLDGIGGRWLSVDEGDMALEAPLEVTDPLPDPGGLRIGQTLGLGGEKLTVTEKNTGTCLGFEGELPEVIFPGDKHDYVHLSGAKGRLVTLEFFNDHALAYKGTWIDPFDVEPL